MPETCQCSKRAATQNPILHSGASENTTDKHAMKRLRLLIILCAPLLLLACSKERPEPARRSLERTASCLQERLDAIDQGLHAAAVRLEQGELAGEGARQVLEELHAGIPAAIDCVTIDTQGRIRELFPESYAGVLNRVVIDQPQVEQALRSSRPAMSGLFRSVEGIEAIDAEYPVLRAEQQTIGTVSLLFRPQELIARCTRPETRTDGIRFMAFTTDGTLLYRSDSTLALPDATTLERLLGQEEGEAENKATPGETFFWKSVGLYGSSWRIAAWPARRAAGE